MKRKIDEEKVEEERMKEAYYLLFKIENKLRKMLTPYHSDVNSLSYFNLIALAKSYPQVYSQLTPLLLKRLSYIKEIRNKICHTNVITGNDFFELSDVYKELEAKVPSKPIKKKKAVRKKRLVKIT